MNNNDFLNDNQGLNNNTDFNNNLNNESLSNQEPISINDEAQISMLLQPQNSSDVSQTNDFTNEQFDNQNVSEPTNFMNTIDDSSLQQDNFNQINDIGVMPQNDFQNVSVAAMPSQNLEYQNQTYLDNNSSDDEELLRAFVGKNYDKITNNPFNFAGFFFTTAYLFYRKMFLYGMILFIANLIVSLLVSNASTTIIVGAAVGFFVNKVYLNYAKKKVASIKLKNSDKDFEELKRICSKKGGTSIGRVILGFLLEMVIALVAIILMLVFGMTAIFGETFTEIIDELKNGEIQESANNNGTYDGGIMYDTSINMKNEFSISVPSVFKDDSDEYEYEYEYESGQGVFDDCSVSLYVPSGYSSAENLLNQMATYYQNDNPTDIASATLNGIEWHAFSYNDAFGTKYYYGTTKNNKVYLLEYEVQEDAANDCDSYRQSILNSITKK